MDYCNELIKLMFWVNYIWIGCDFILYFKKVVVMLEVYIFVVVVSLCKKIKWNKCNFVCVYEIKRLVFYLIESVFFVFFVLGLLKWIIFENILIELFLNKICLRKVLKVKEWWNLYVRSIFYDFFGWNLM